MLTVAADGSVKQVTVQTNPGHGFGQAALKCAKLMKFDPGRDAKGQPVQSRVSIVVRFIR